MLSELLTSADVAKIAGVAPATVRWWEKSGKLKARKTTSGVRLFSRETVDRFVRRRATLKAAEPKPSMTAA